MTRGVTLTRVTVTITSLCHCHVARWQIDTWQFFDFFKKIKKKINKKVKNKINKKIQKNEELTRGTPSNGVNLDLTGKGKCETF